MRNGTVVGVVCGLALGAGCSGAGEPELPERLHLAFGLEAAEVATGPPPARARETRRWSFAQEQPEWETLSAEVVGLLSPVERTRTDDGLRLAFAATSFPVGGLRIELGELDFSDWDVLVVEARTSERFAGVTVVPNLAGSEDLPGVEHFFASTDEAPPIFSDGSVQRYAIPIRRMQHVGEDEALESLSILFGAPSPAAIDVLSVELVPRGADFLEPTGTRNVVRDGLTMHALFAHAPARMTWRVRARPESRLDFALSASPGERVTYRIEVKAAGIVRELFEETVDDGSTWRQHSVGLGATKPETVELTLLAESEDEGALALWGAPVLSLEGVESDRPNVIFYVIDGGDADFMSLYGYERPTTEFMEELAGEGVLFTRAYSNATWTQPSTVSFMTSLHHSVLGGLQRGIHSTSVPANAVTMADHFRNAGYVTASFTANPNAGRIIGTDKGVDVMRDAHSDHHSTASLDLHDDYRQFRANYPGEPYWVHLQTTDVHEPSEPVEPFAGRFTSKVQRRKLEKWEGDLWRYGGADFGKTDVVGFYELGIERGEIPRREFYEGRRDLYDETMLHQDWSLSEFVADLKARGEWEDTIFVIGSDHGHPAGTFARFGRGLLDPKPERWVGAMCDAYATRIPLLVIWPGKIEGGRVIDDPVSMIDVLPTLLELAGLPAPEVTQGQSLAPLLRGHEMDLAPVILDEFRVDQATGEMIGNLEIIDGRWGASLEIGPVPEGHDPARGRRTVPAGGRWGSVHPFFPEAPKLLLFDLEADPYTTRDLSAEEPELAAKYEGLLREIWEGHRTLALQFEGGGDVEYSPEQLEQLRALGYIR